jgi:hypothetical protein
MVRQMEQLFMARGIPMGAICLDGAATIYMGPFLLQKNTNILLSPRESIGGHRLKSYGTGILTINGYRLQAVYGRQVAIHIAFRAPRFCVEGLLLLQI